MAKKKLEIKPSSYSIRKQELLFKENKIVELENKLASIVNVADQKKPITASIFEQTIPLAYTNSLLPASDVSTWFQALIAAQNKQYPNRQLLYRLYNSYM